MRRTVYLSLMIVAVGAITALIGPATSMAASGEPCPPGYKGTVQPYCQKITPQEEEEAAKKKKEEEEAKAKKEAEEKKKKEEEAKKPPPFTIASIVNEVVSGKVKVTFSVPGAGSLSLKGNAIKTFKVQVTAAGQLVVTLRATGKVLQHLENKGWTRKKQIFVTFTATDGTSQTIKVVVRFRKP